MSFKLRISRGRTINKGNYESYRYDVSLEEEFDDDTSYNEAYDKLSDLVYLMAAREEENAN